MLCLRSMFARACQSLELRNDQRALICRRVCQQALARYSLMAGRALARAPDFCAAGCASGQGRSDGGDHGVRRAACSGFALSCAGCVQAPLIHVVGRRPSGAVQALQTEASSIPSCSGRWCALVCWTRCPARRALRLTRAGVCALAGSAALLRPAPQVRRPGGRQHPLSCVCVVLRTSRRHESSFASIEGALLRMLPHC